MDCTSDAGQTANAQGNSGLGVWFAGRRGAFALCEPRLTMLETAREDALERLQESGELDRLRRRHAGYFLGLAEEERASQGPLQGAWLDWLQTEHNNLLAALTWRLTP